MIAHKFGRQYLISNRKLEVENDWNIISSDDNQLFIHTHPLIECTTSKNIDTEVFLVGYILNPTSPQESNQEIIDHLVSYNNLEEFIKATFKYGGRYLLVFKQSDKIHLIPDSIAYREAYYYFENDNFYIASQVKLIAKLNELKQREDNEFKQFIASRSFQTLNIQSFIGDDTHYLDVKHLLPNHYLDISHKKSIRFFPLDEISKIDIDVATEQCALLLQGLMQAIALRTDVSVAFTSGWDSRLTVAATQAIKDKVLYFINNYPHMNSKSPDIWVPEKLSKKIGIDFKILPLEKSIEDEFANIYNESYDFPTENLMTVHYTMAKRATHNMNVLTIGSEIGRGSKMARSFYTSNVQMDGEKLAQLAYFRNDEYAKVQCEKWLSELKQYDIKSIHLIDLFFWEHRVGIWGARSATLADIYRETFTPFNCRELLITMLGLEAKYRQHNSVLYTNIIKKLSPKLMTEPVNPPANNKERIKKLLMNIGVFNLLKSLKYKS